MFAETLSRVLSETPGGLSVTLMGFDGIAIDSKERPEAQSLNLQATAIEFGAVAAQLRHVVDGLGGGQVHEVMIAGSTVTTLLRTLTPDYFVALSLRNDGNSGKGRYLLRVAAPLLAGELLA